MKPLRVLLVVSAAIVALLGLAVGALLLPSVQGWALRRWVATQPGLKLEVGRVAAGLGSVRLEQVQAEQDGAVVKLASLDAEYDLLDAALGRAYSVRGVRVVGLEADLTRYRPAVQAASSSSTAAAPAAVPGVLGQIQMPVVLNLDDVQAAGTVVLAGSAGPARADFKLNLDQFGPGREGTLRLEATVKPGATGPVTELSGNFALLLAQSAQRTFTKAELKGRVDATGPQVAAGRQLLFESSLYRTGRGDDYAAQVDLLNGSERARLLSFRATLPSGTKRYEGEWTVAVGREQLETFVLGRQLPYFAARGSGKFSATPEQHAVTVDGTLTADIRELEVLDPAWRAFGRLALKSDFDLSFNNGILDLNRLSVALNGEKPVLQLGSTGAVRADLRGGLVRIVPGAGASQLDLTLHALPLAWIRPFVVDYDLSGGDLSGRATIARAAGAESARVTAQFNAPEINLVREGRAMLRGGRATVAVDALLDAEHVQADRFDATLETPGGERVKFSGKFKAGLAAGSPIETRLTVDVATAKGLASILPGAPVNSHAELAVNLRDGLFEVLPGKVEIRQGAEAPLFTLGFPQSFTLNPATFGVKPADATKPVAQIDLGRLPLSLLSSLPLGGLTLGGEVRAARFEVVVDGPKLVVRTPQPVTLAGLAVQQAGRPLLTETTLTLQPKFELAPGMVGTASFGDIVLRDRTGMAMLQLTSEASRAADGGLRAALTFNVNLPALASQPALASALALSAGRASGEFRAAMAGEAVQVEARTTLNGLVLRDDGRALPVANLSLKAVGQPDGKFTVQIPLLIDRAGKRSDLNLEANGFARADGASFEAQLKGEQVELEDALLLLAALGAPVAETPASGAAAESRALSPPTADAAPFWSGVQGGLSLQLKSVTRGTAWAMSGLNGRVSLLADRLELEKLEADFGGASKLSAQGRLAFSPGAEPYTLQGSFKLSEFDAGKLLKAFDPSQPPVVDGVFNVQATLAGQGLTLADLTDRVRGDFALTSRGGIFRGLKRTSEKVSVATKAVELGAALGSLLGSSKVAKAAEKVAGQTYQVDQVAQALGELNYDQLSLHLVRDEALNIALKDFALVTPELRLLGAGQVTHVAGRPLLGQPLAATLSLGARGKTEELLNKLRILDGTRDELDYARAREKLTIAGTLARPDPSAFFTRIASAKLGEMLSPDKE